jgi:hypothetical protein
MSHGLPLAARNEAKLAARRSESQRGRALEDVVGLARDVKELREAEREVAAKRRRVERLERALGGSDDEGDDESEDGGDEGDESEDESDGERVSIGKKSRSQPTEITRCIANTKRKRKQRGLDVQRVFFCRESGRGARKRVQLFSRVRTFRPARVTPPLGCQSVTSRPSTASARAYR